MSDYLADLFDFVGELDVASYDWRGYQQSNPSWQPLLYWATTETCTWPGKIISPDVLNFMLDTWCDLIYWPSIILRGSLFPFLTLLNAQAGIRWSCAWVHDGLQANVRREDTHSGSKVILIGDSEWLCGKFTHLPNFLILILKGAIEVLSCSSAATTFSSLLAVCWHELKPLLLISLSVHS